MSPLVPTGRSTAAGVAGSLALATALAGQTGSLTGIVRADRGGPVADVEVVIRGHGAPTTSGADGRFRIEEVPAGVQVVVFRRIGFRPQALTVAVTPGDRVLGAVVLEAGAFKLADLEVAARSAKPARYANTTKYDDFYRRRASAGGIFLDREALEQRFTMHTHQVLRGLPGVRVEDGTPGIGSKVWFNRCNESPPAIALYVDGTRMIPPWGISNGYGVRRRTDDQIGRGVAGNARARIETMTDARTRFVEEMLDTVSPADIEAIEVFKGPGQLPGEFNAGDNCGAIAIWTRQGGFRAVDSAGAGR